MLYIEFSVDKIYDTLSGFDLGHIDIIYNNSLKTSRNRTPDQSMMVFVTISDLLDGLRCLFVDRKRKEFKLVGADSSFIIRFKRLKNSIIGIYIDGSIFVKINESELAICVYNACKSFYEKYKMEFLKDDVVKNDIELSLNSFKSDILKEIY